VEFALGEEIAARSVIPITLLLAVFKFDRMEWAIEKCTELNVASIIPVIASRTEKHLAVAAEKRAERWRRIAREASEQSRRTAPPEIAVPVKLSEALQLRMFSRAPHHDQVAGAAARLRIVLDETEREASLADILQAHGKLESLALAVGPEGGWTTDELRSFATSEWQWISASLGETILRAETAAIAALAIARAVT
jgi:16S rRNA (uracil1498-N3)-methyltransferase